MGDFNSSTLNIVSQPNYRKAGDNATSTFAPPVNLARTYSGGTGASQADLLFDDDRTLSASASEDIDLAGALSDHYAATLTFARVAALIINNYGATDIQIDTSVTNGWTAAIDGAITIKAGGCLVLESLAHATNYAVTAGTGDIVRVTNLSGAAGAEYQIQVVGKSS